MSDLREYLDSQIKELSGRLLVKQEEVQSLKSELADAHRALAAISRQPAARARSRSRSPSRYPESIKTMVRKVLAGAGGPMSADKIQDAIYRVFGSDVVRTSLSPQLSRLVASGEVEFLGGVYRLSRVSEES